MARRERIVKISAEGRDRGKTFLITEMPATRSEKWGMRTINAIVRSGVHIPDDIAARGLAGLAVVGMRGLFNIAFDEAEPLLDEMMSCVRCMPDPARPEVIRAMVETDTEEFATIALLRSEVIDLHVGFSIAGWLSNRWSSASQTTAAGDTSTTETSPAP